MFLRKSRYLALEASVAAVESLARTVADIVEHNTRYSKRVLDLEGAILGPGPPSPVDVMRQGMQGADSKGFPDGGLLRKEKLPDSVARVRADAFDDTCHIQSWVQPRNGHIMMRLIIGSTLMAKARQGDTDRMSLTVTTSGLVKIDLSEAVTHVPGSVEMVRLPKGSVRARSTKWHHRLPVDLSGGIEFTPEWDPARGSFVISLGKLRESAQ